MEGGDRTFRANFSSEGVSRLRNDVMGKLNEFMGDYTDDTLVEYIIVLLKNGRRKDEAKSELGVFLGDDTDSFVSWLWNHLGLNLRFYVEPEELHAAGDFKTETILKEQAGKFESDQTGSEDKRTNSDKPSENHNLKSKYPEKDDGENKALVPGSYVAEKENFQDGPQSRASRSRVSPSPRWSVEKKRRRTEERKSRKREVSASSVSAPRRLLQFAVRDAVGTSRHFNPTPEQSLKRLHSVVSASTGDSPEEERPQRLRRISMSAAIKAVAEAAMDVNKAKRARNVFDRLGGVTDFPNSTNSRENAGVDEGIVGRDALEMEDLHSECHVQNDDCKLQESDMLPLHNELIDLRQRQTTSRTTSRFGSFGGGWMEHSQMFQNVATATATERLRRSQKQLIHPENALNTSLRIVSSVSRNTRIPLQYIEERDRSGMESDKVLQGSDILYTESEVRSMKENNDHTVVLTQSGNPDTTSQQAQRPQSPIGSRHTVSLIEDVNSRTIFVSNVHYSATKDSLSLHFNKFGEVLKVIILTDPATGQPKGSAYIEFMRKDAAELALSLNGTSFLFRILKITKKTPAQTEATSATTWPRLARPSPFPVARFGRVPIPRGIPSLYRTRIPITPGTRSFQWKRESNSNMTETATQPSINLPHPHPHPTRSLTYVRAELQTNGNTGNA